MKDTYSMHTIHNKKENQSHDIGHSEWKTNWINFSFAQQLTQSQLHSPSFWPMVVLNLGAFVNCKSSMISAELTIRSTFCKCHAKAKNKSMLWKAMFPHHYSRGWHLVWQWTLNCSDSGIEIEEKVKVKVKMKDYHYIWTLWN